MKKCILCKIKIEEYNKSGYCSKCYRISPQYLKYQREFQAKLRKTPKHKKRVAEYNKRPEVIKRKKAYQKIWMHEHRERMKELRRNWANKPENKLKLQKYERGWREKRKKIFTTDRRKVYGKKLKGGRKRNGKKTNRSCRSR
jgi:hypothetical protein